MEEALPFAPVSVTTKFQPPRPVGDWVARARLTDLLRAGEHRRLSLIHAPAGFGKSTLAAQWLAALDARGVTTVWLSLDRDDNNTIWFLSHLLEAIRRVMPELDDEWQVLLEGQPDDAERYVVPALVNAMDAAGENIVIALDDWHLVTDSRTRAVIHRLLDVGSSRLSFLITSRSRSGLPLGRLMVRNQLLEVDASSLRFDEDESQALLVDINGLDVNRDDLASLHRTTEGWVAALQLVSLSLRENHDASDLIRRLSGRQKSIGEYLLENVLDALEPDVVDFLLTTSVTERICAELASTLSGVVRGQAMLERVEAQNLFLQPLNEDGSWYRYHHLFEDYLRGRLERDFPGRAVELNLAAARWFASNGYPSDAVDHALAVGQVDFAVDIVESRAMWLVEHSRMATLLVLVGKIPASSVADQAKLQMAIAWANTLLHISGAAQIALDKVEALVRCDDSLSQDDRFELGVEALVVQCCIDMYVDRLDLVDELDQTCFAEANRLRPWIVSVAANISTFQKIQEGEYSQATEQQNWASQFHALTSGPFSDVYGRCFAGLAAFEQLEVDDAERLFRSAVELARSSAGRHSHAAQLASSMLGQLLYERGALEKAELLLEEAHELGSEGGVVDFMISAFATLARIKALRGDHVGARTLLDEGEDVAETLGLTRLGLCIAAERIQLGFNFQLPDRTLPAGLHDEQHRIGDLGSGLAETNYRIALATEIRAALSPDASRDLATASAERAHELLDRTRARGGARAHLGAQILLAATLQHAGRRVEAMDALTPALVTCNALGLVRPILDGGPGCLQIVQDVADRVRGGRWEGPQAPGLPEFLSLLLQSATTSARLQETTSSGAQITGATLTEREHEILILLAQGCSNREIAQTLHLGVNTVKWYLKRLFSTLGVSGRQGCVDEARRRKLLSTHTS
ncbi:LuxR family transcriptional regulator [Cryobacterium sp. TMT1-21]|uniref:LuxR family transcriptional regulator n=1 Tax=Cryobacterium shii TaxID=1259235 RepID=A0AAQ2C7P3_9MICO|nr:MULTISPECIES: LuxR C-terminal-related transcriptional regulator [Cryobacterium]TFC49697.1 LuxR family transcriptional regulator [Cryobacterium shii]TFC82054.1 LuxR family transcriptional regulator [Cryobacterium sp. TmT2-59]TFD11398.1 LuxR family transcriptional regulator [Cryobacterium sp. TMT4-10]TFD15592.1 LuxR family transcriptional regulator [Cryobacterium sp. TMT1-21]TFD19450.1 LuxR family transcriptional regulator [Cryobacterium sp. TMT2-23]